MEWKQQKNIPMAQNTSNDVFCAMFPSPLNFPVVVRNMGIASCEIVPKYVVSKCNQMKKKGKFTNGPKHVVGHFLGIVSVTSESPCCLSTWLAAMALLSLSLLLLSLSCDCRWRWELIGRSVHVSINTCSANCQSRDLTRKWKSKPCTRSSFSMCGKGIRARTGLIWGIIFFCCGSPVRTGSRTELNSSVPVPVQFLLKTIGSVLSSQKMGQEPDWTELWQH